MKYAKQMSAVAIVLGAGAAGALDIVESGRPLAIVVTADEPDEIVQDAVACLNQYIEKAAGCRLKVVGESSAPRDAALIVLGDTAMTREAGVDVSAVERDGYALRVRGSRLVIAGPDVDYRKTNRPIAGFESVGRNWMDYQVRRGTLMGVIRFLHDHCGVRWYLPTPKGEAVPRLKNVSVPDDLDVRYVPPFAAALNNAGYSAGISNNRWAYTPGVYWCAANNYRWPINYLHLGGHSWDLQLKLSREGKTFEDIFEKHPDWFGERGGKRRMRSPHGNTLCTSNPAVADLLTESMALLFDHGWDLVQYNQSDGYTRCQCAKCEAMDNYRINGIADPDNPCDRLHLPAREMARRLLKRHPGKRILMMAYGPTRTPPGAFESYPPNVVIQLGAEREGDLKAWANVAPVRSVWLYWFGCFQKPGITIKTTPNFVAEKLRLLHRYGVEMLYWGWVSAGETWGMEGPVYHVMGQLLGDPSVDVDRVLNEYYEGVYGTAAPAMKAFFAPLFEAFDERYFGDGARVDDAEDVFTKVYTRELLDQMEASLANAERLADSEMAKGWIALSRDQFDYVRFTSRAYHAYHDFLDDRTRENLMAIKSWIDKRNEYIKRLRSLGRDEEFVKNWYPGHRGLVRYVERNGRLRNQGVLYAPFTWDWSDPDRILVSAATAMAARSREEVTIDGVPDEAAWQEAIPYDLRPIQKLDEGAETSVRVLRNDVALFFAFSCRESEIERLPLATTARDAKVWAGDCVEVLLARQQDKGRRMRFALQPGPGAGYDARKGYIEDVAHPLVNSDDPSWNAEWEHRVSVDKAKKRWTAEVRIPFVSLGFDPDETTTLRANFVRRRAVDPAQIYSWARPRGGAPIEPEDFGQLCLKNIVSDATLESAVKGAKPSWRLNGFARRQQQVARSGRCAAQLSIPAEGVKRRYAILSLASLKVKGGERVRVSAWIRIDDPIRGSGDPREKPGLWLTTTVRGDKHRLGRIVTEKIRRTEPTNGWVEIQDTYDLSPKADRVGVSVSLAGIGEAWVDDVSVVLLSQE